MALTTFERVEQKYIIDREQKKALCEFLPTYMSLDEYCLNESTYRIRNIYLDTDDDHLIRTSLLKPKFKEKIRLRKYTGQEGMFIELKLKYDGIVGKRRTQISEQELDDWLNHHIKPVREKYQARQIVNEIDYFLKLNPVKKKVFISYDRLGYFQKDDKDLRVTFDENLRYNTEDLSWDNTTSKLILDDDHFILEIKDSKNLPIWLIRKLDELGIHKHSFSKYGREHMLTLEENLNALHNL